MKHLLAFILIIFIYGCGNAYPKKENSDMNGYGYRIIIVDSCEYITSPHGLTHKGNCKYCLKRQNKIQKADSIVFHYDSILVIHYNRSEVK